MSEFLIEYGLFLAKTLTLVAGLLAVFAGLAGALRAARASQTQDHLEIRHLNARYRELADQLEAELLDSEQLKQRRKARRQQDKERRKREKQGAPTRPRVFTLQFKGDLHAHAVESLREEVSALLQVSQPHDEVLVRLESEGGLVHAYGLAASQLARIRARQLKLTVAVDKVAASGGYMMACVADRILAAPFAVLGSIGVVAQIPNFNRLLKRHDVDLELHTAGEYKRTLTLFGENTEAGRAKFREELQETHDLFKAFVAEHRPQLDLARVATGEHWFGARALELKLVDHLQTSDDYLLQRLADADLYELRHRKHHRLGERLSQGLVQLGQALRRGAEDTLARRWP
ncbi:MAG TPA: protease SohB [Solimonas sp.]|nr:protease SohB [Solimonas sp.]